MYCKSNFKKMQFYFLEEMDLMQYTTTTYDVQKKFKRSLPNAIAVLMDMDEVKAATTVNKKRS
jgi:hypothetical protein